MLMNSSPFQSSMRRDYRKFYSRITIGQKTYSNEDIYDLSFDSGTFNGEAFGIGATYASKLKIVFSDLIEDLSELDEVIVEIGIERSFIQGESTVSTKLDKVKVGQARLSSVNLIELADRARSMKVGKARLGHSILNKWNANESIEYARLGKFYISGKVDIDRNEIKTTIECSDNMIFLEGSYTSNLNYPAPLRNVVSEICQMSKIRIDGRSFMDMNSVKVNQINGLSYRQALSLLAQIEGKSVYVNRFGYITFKSYKSLGNSVVEPYNAQVIRPTEYFAKGLVKNDLKYSIEGLTCIVNQEGTDNVTLTAGSKTGAHIQFENMIMTQSLLDRLYSRLKGVSFYPFSLEWSGNPSFETGDIIEVSDIKGNTYQVPNLSFQMQYNGGLKAISKAEVVPYVDVVSSGRKTLDQRFSDTYQYTEAVKQVIQADIGQVIEKVNTDKEFIQNEIQEVSDKIDEEIAQGEADKQELAEKISAAEQEAKEYADNLAEEWDQGFVIEKEKISKEINDSRTLAEGNAKKYADQKATELDTALSAAKTQLGKDISTAQTNAVANAKIYTDAREKAINTTISTTEGSLKSEISSAQTNAVTLSKQYADSTAYIASIKTKILVANSIIADYLNVDKAMIDKLVANTIFTESFFANTATISKLKTTSLETVYADISNLKTKVLTADSITATMIKADSALFKKLITDSLFVTEFFGNTAIVSQLKTKSLEAVYADIANLTSKIITADSITSINLKVDSALIDKLITNSLFVTTLFAQSAFITNLKTKTLDAVYADIATIRTKLLTANVVKADMIESSEALFNKVFANDAYFKKLVANDAFFGSLMAKKFIGVEIEGGTIVNPFDALFENIRFVGNTKLADAKMRVDYNIPASNQTGYTEVNPRGTIARLNRPGGQDLDQQFDVNFGGFSLQKYWNGKIIGGSMSANDFYDSGWIQLTAINGWSFQYTTMWGYVRQRGTKIMFSGRIGGKAGDSLSSIAIVLPVAQFLNWQNPETRIFTLSSYGGTGFNDHRMRCAILNGTLTIASSVSSSTFYDMTGLTFDLNEIVP